MNFAHVRRRTKLRGACFAVEGRRADDQRRAIEATELQRFIRLHAITLGTAFHFFVAQALASVRSCVVRQIHLAHSTRPEL